MKEATGLSSDYTGPAPQYDQAMSAADMPNIAKNDVH